MAKSETEKKAKYVDILSIHFARFLFHRASLLSCYIFLPIYLNRQNLTLLFSARLHSFEMLWFTILVAVDVENLLGTPDQNEKRRRSQRVQ